MINEGHYTELIDRIYIIIDNLNNHVIEHPLIDHLKNEEINKKLNSIMDDLCDIYQIIGSLDVVNNK